MKKNLVTPIALTYLAMALLGCQRTNDVIPAGAAKTGTDATAAAITINPYTILNIATGFNNPKGIYLKASGLLYVADNLSNSIKKVELTPVSTTAQYTSIVTTLNTPAGENGLAMTSPIDVGISKNGSINVLFNSGSITFGRIYDPSGKVYTLPVSRGGAIDMSGDSNGDFFWFCSNDGIGKFWSSHIQLPNFKVPVDSLYAYSHGNKIPSTNPPNRIYAAANGVKYLGTYSQLYKLTSGGQFIRLKPYADFPYEPYQDMTGMVASADGKVIYFTKNGSIMKLENEVITTLYYPYGQTSSQGQFAFINAGELAIDDKEHLLYFSDSYGSGDNIKALTLPGYQAH